MDNLKLDAIGLSKCPLFRNVNNLNKDGTVGRCLTRVELTIKVWSDVHGGDPTSMAVQG